MPVFYFDHNATTPVAPEVFEAVAPMFSEVFGNASSIHYHGQAAKRELEEARREVAALLNAEPEEIVFTSGGTESDNLAIFGAARGGHVVATTIEHSAVLQTTKHYGNATFVEVDVSGVADPNAVRAAIRPGETTLVAVMHANNETGAIQPVAEIARIAHEAGALFHCDGVQAAGKIAVDVKALEVDFYAISGHKIYAPKGVGALYVRKGTPIAKFLHGGHHERDRRPGTENVAGAVGLGRAAKLALEKGAAERERLGRLRDRLEHGILTRIADTQVNGQGERTPNTTNIRIDGVEGEAMVIALDLRGFCVSTGAACSSGAVAPSHVLTAMGLTRDQAKSSLRFSLGTSNTEEQVDALIEAVVKSVAHLRKLSTAYA